MAMLSIKSEKELLKLSNKVKKLNRELLKINKINRDLKKSKEQGVPG